MFMRLKLSYGLIKAKGLMNERCHLLSIAKQNRLENADKLRWIIAVIEIIKYALLPLRVNILRDRNVLGLSLAGLVSRLLCKIHTPQWRGQAWQCVWVARTFRCFGKLAAVNIKCATTALCSFEVFF